MESAIRRRMEEERNGHLDLSADERKFLRNGLRAFFGKPPTLENGIFLQSLGRGDKRGMAKIPKSALGLVERGLLEVRKAHIGHAAFFTEIGLEALRALALSGRRALDPKEFGPIWAELGLAPPGQE